MKFKRILKLITPITIVSLLLLLIPSYPPVKIINADEDKLVFSVISDVHIKNIATQEQTKFENALKYLNNKYPEMDITPNVFLLIIPPLYRNYYWISICI